MLKEQKNKLAIICPYPYDIAPGQRFRYELLLKESNKLDVSTFSFLSKKTNSILYKKGFFFKKLTGIILGYIRRLKHIFKIIQYDYVLIFREASPLGPPIFEFIIAKILRKKIIYDFDDAIWLPNTSRQNKIAASLKWHHKVAKICKWSYKVSCGNKYLADYAKKFNKNVFIIPTIVDTEKRHNPDLIQKEINKKLTIGWTGSHSTLVYLDDLIPILQELEKEIDFNFLVIANHNPEIPFKNYQFFKWNEKTEIEDLSKIDIGVMPLPDNQWTRGKCGFKAIQYMALGIPAIVSPVSANTKIVDNEINGYWCNTFDEWKISLKKLLTNENLRIEMGISARKKIEENYSVKAIKRDFFELFT